MADTDSLPPPVDNNPPPQTQPKQLGEWGEPISINIPAPLADIFRNVAKTHANGNSFRHRGTQGRNGRRTMGRGRQGRKQNKTMRGNRRSASPQRKEVEEEVSEEILELRKELQAVEEEKVEEREKNAVPPIVEKVEKSSTDWDSVLNLVQAKIVEAKKNNEEVPTWVEQILKEKKEEPPLVKALPLVQAHPLPTKEERKMNQEKRKLNQEKKQKNQEERKMNQEKRKMNQEKKQKNQEERKVNQEKRQQNQERRKMAQERLKNCQSQRKSSPNGRRKMPPRGRSSERKIVGNFGPFEMELTVTEKETPIKGKCGPKGNRNSCKKGGNRNNRQSMKNNKQVKEMENEEKKIIEGKAETFYPEGEKEEEKKVEKKEETQQNENFSQAELYQIFTAAMNQLSKN